MNIFVLDYDVKKCAEYHCDRHVVKMILESAQMLSTCSRFYGYEQGYKSTHLNHPCNKWVRESLSNYNWLLTLMTALHDEWRYRYSHSRYHKSFELISSFSPVYFEDKGLTSFALAMPSVYKCDDAVTAYRNYYMGDKRDIVSWKKREKPFWYI